MPGVKVFRYVAQNPQEVNARYKSLDQFNADINDYLQSLPPGLPVNVQSHLGACEVADTIVVVISWNQQRSMP